MGVQQDDFVGLAAVDLAGVAQPDHVLRVVAAVVVAHAGLRHHERLEAFPAQFLQHGRGGDVAVPLRAAFVRASAKMDGATARIWSSDKGRSERSTGEREAKRDASCMAFLLTKKKGLLFTAHRIPRFGSPAFRLFGAVGTRNPVGPVATVFPEFIARDGQERANGCRQGGKRRVGAARRRSRGHGPARLDGTRARATVAVKVMKSGETAGHGNGPSTPTARQAKRRPGSRNPGRRRQPSGARERWKPIRGETPQAARCATRTTARPATFLAGDAQPSRLDAQAHAPVIGKQVRQRLPWSGRSGAAGSAVFEGRQASRGGDSPQGFPWRQAQRATPRQGHLGITPSRQDAGWIPQPASKAKSSSGSSACHAHTAPKAR